jgi:hypothetical protein
MAWTSASTRPDKIKSLCEGYHIDNELDHARLLTYTSQRRLICEGKVRDQRWQEINFGEYPKPPRTVDRVPVVFFSIDSTVYPNGNRRASKEESSNDNSHKSSARLKN